MSPPGRPKGEHRSAQHEGGPVGAAETPANAWRMDALVAEAEA